MEDRVEELADRQYGYRPPGAAEFTYLLPLHELIATGRGLSLSSEQRLYSPTVWEEYNRIVGAFGNEFNALMDAPEKALKEVASKEIAGLIVGLRRNELQIIPGFDGTYGRIVFKEEPQSREAERARRVGFEDFL